MRLPALLILSFCSAVVLPAQGEHNTVDRISISADQAGREAFCEQLRRMSTRPNDVPIVPEKAELLCDGAGASIFALRLAETPSSTDQFICEFAAKPSALIFYQMQPIALKRGSVITPVPELTQKLQPFISTVGGLLNAFGFVKLELRLDAAKAPLREIGFHEIPLLCKS